MTDNLKRRTKFNQKPKGFFSLSGENVSACFQNHKEGIIQPVIIKQARKSGQLNLSNRGIVDVPDVVWDINMISSEEVKALSLSLEAGREEDRWWEQVELTKLILASNSISSICPRISQLGALTVLDLHDNQLESLPTELGTLGRLSRLNLGHNKLTALPDSLFCLKELLCLQVQHNSLAELSDDISNLSLLEELDLSHNQLTSLPATVGFLTRVVTLLLSHNHLATLPEELGDMRAVATLDLTHNCLEELPEALGRLGRLEQLYLRHNQLRELPPFTDCHHIKEIQAGNNKIAELGPELLQSLVPVKILDLRDNKLEALPEDMVSLQALERLDLANNSLATLPYTLGTLPHLKFLALEGNPLRAIRRDVMQRGTVQLLKWLRSRLDPSVLPTSSPPRPSGSQPDPHTARATHSLSYSKAGLAEVTPDMCRLAVECAITTLDLSHNQITSLPDCMAAALEKLEELNASFNRLQHLSPAIGMASRLVYLNLGNNQLTQLPPELASVSQLREINLSFNRFLQLPPALLQLSRLEILLIADNKLEEVPVEGLAALPRLATLDLRNNNLKAVPPQLGLVTQLRSLSLEGNMFRAPRADILAKGTPFLLEYLRNRIPS